MHLRPLPRVLSFTIAASIAAVSALTSSPAPAAVPDRWMIQAIARDTGVSPAEVRYVLGDSLAVAASQYSRHPAGRGAIKRSVRRRFDQGLARRPPRLEADRAQAATFRGR